MEQIRILIVYYPFTIVPIIGTSGADNWVMPIIGSLRYMLVQGRLMLPNVSGFAHCCGCMVNGNIAKEYCVISRCIICGQ